MNQSKTKRTLFFITIAFGALIGSFARADSFPPSPPDLGAEISSCYEMLEPNSAAITCRTGRVSCQYEQGCIVVRCSMLYGFKEVDLSYLSSWGRYRGIETVPVTHIKNMAQRFAAWSDEFMAPIPTTAPLAGIQRIATQMRAEVLDRVGVFIAENSAWACSNQ